MFTLPVVVTAANCFGKHQEISRMPGGNLQPALADLQPLISQHFLQFTLHMSDRFKTTPH